MRAEELSVDQAAQWGVDHDLASGDDKQAAPTPGSDGMISVDSQYDDGSEAFLVEATPEAIASVLASLEPEHRDAHDLERLRRRSSHRNLPRIELSPFAAHGDQR